MKLPFLLGRTIFGGFFIYNGINHLKNRKMLAEYAKAKNVPAPEVGVVASGAMMLLGGASILLGVRPKLGAAAVVTFLASVSPLMHDFWRDEDPNQKQANMINFMKNMALAGGAMALMAVEEPWPASPEARQRQRDEGHPRHFQRYRRSKIAA